MQTSEFKRDDFLIKCMTQDKNITFRNAKKIITIFKKTLDYFAKKGDKLRISGFLKLHKVFTKERTRRSPFSGATYEIPDHYEPTIVADRRLKNFLNRRKESENFGETYDLPKD